MNDSVFFQDPDILPVLQKFLFNMSVRLDADCFDISHVIYIWILMRGKVKLMLQLAKIIYFISSIVIFDYISKPNVLIFN